MKKKIVIAILSIVAILVIAGIILGTVFQKDIQLSNAKNKYKNGEYREAVNLFSEQDDEVKMNFAKENINGDMAFITDLLDTIKEPEYNKDKLDLYLNIIKNKELDYLKAGQIYRTVKNIDEHYEYQSTREIILTYAQILCKYYDTKINDATNYQEVLRYTMQVSEQEGATELINKCNGKIIEYYMSNAKNKASQTLYADAIRIYKLAISKIEEIDNDDLKDKLEQCKNELAEVEQKSKTYTWCEAYGCARHKENGNAHYCSIHEKDPTAQTPVATETKTNNSGYSYYHKCEYPGCTNYASASQYCSKHTTYPKCTYPGCDKNVSYTEARYCMEHELSTYNQ